MPRHDTKPLHDCCQSRSDIPEDWIDWQVEHVVLCLLLFGVLAVISRIKLGSLMGTLLHVSPQMPAFPGIDAMPACGQEDVARPSMFCIKPLCRMPGMHRHRHSRETLSAALEQPESRSTPGEGDGYDRLMDAHIWNKKARRDLFANVCHLAAVFLCSSFLVLDADFRCRLLAFQSVPIFENMRQDSLIGGPAVSAGISSGRAAIKYSHLALTKKRKVFVSCSPRLG